LRLYLSHLRSFSREARLFLVTLAIFALATSVPGLFFNLYLQALGFDRAFIGLTTTVAQLGGAIASIPAAALLDTIGRRRAMITGVLAAIVCATATLLTTNGLVILAIQVVGGCGIVLYALAVIPLLAEASTPRERTTLFSTVDGISTLASFAGSLIAGGLPIMVATLIHAEPESAQAYRIAMLGSLAVRALGIIPLALIHDDEHKQLTANSPVYRKPRSTLSYFDPRVLLKVETPIWRFALPVLITYTAAALITPFLTLFIKERFAVSDVVLGIVFGSVNLAVGVCTMLGPFIANVFGRTRAVILGAFFSALCLILIGFGNVFAVVAALIIIRAGAFNMTLPLYRAYVIDHTPPHEYAVVNLIYATAANVGPTISPTVSGYVQDRYGFNPLFVTAIGLYALAGLVFHLATRAKTSR
jgi:MFS family permease